MSVKSAVCLRWRGGTKSTVAQIANYIHFNTLYYEIFFISYRRRRIAFMPDFTLFVIVSSD